MVLFFSHPTRQRKRRRQGLGPGRRLAARVRGPPPDLGRPPRRAPGLEPPAPPDRPHGVQREHGSRAPRRRARAQLRDPVPPARGARGTPGPPLPPGEHRGPPRAWIRGGAAGPRSLRGATRGSGGLGGGAAVGSRRPPGPRARRGRLGEALRLRVRRGLPGGGPPPLFSPPPSP